MTTCIKQSKDHYYLSEFCTICFSKSEPRFRPCEVEMSSKAFIVTGFLGPSSFLSTTRFLDSYNQTNKKTKLSNHPRPTFLKAKPKKNKTLALLTPDSSKIASTSSRLTSAFSYLGALYPFLNHSFSMTSANVILCINH